MEYNDIVRKKLATNFLRTDWDSFAAFVNQLDTDEMVLYIERQKNIINGTCFGNQDDSNIVIFGSGEGGKKLLQQYRNNKIEVSCFCDNNKNKQHTFIEGVYVIGPEELSKIQNPQIVVASIFWREISSQLKSLNIQHVIVNVNLDWNIKFTDESDIKGRIKFLKNYMKDIHQVYLSLADERSKLVYLNIVKADLVAPILLDKEIYEKISEGNQYWALSAFRGIKDEIYVDAGSCTGDTIEKFLYNSGCSFKKIYAFEAASQYFKILKDNVDEIINIYDFKEDSIECIPEGVGKEEGILTFYCDTNLGCDTFSNVGLEWKRTEEIKVCKLDDYLKDVPVTLIKADIEGSELDMLKGATELIQTYRPKLAICLYHKFEDLFEIPLYIKSIAPDYKMAVRHHSNGQGESVLYCWI